MREETCSVKLKGIAQLENPENFTVVISLDNPYQRDQYFRAFVKEINEAPNVKELTIIDTTYLNRHYDAKYSNFNMKTDWRTQHEKYFAQLKIPYTYKSSRELIPSKEYGTFYRQIQEDYRNDEEFKEKIDGRVNKYTGKKGTAKQVLQYALEECAMQKFITGHILYRGDLNEPIAHVIKKYNIDVKFFSYIAREPKMPSQNIVMFPAPKNAVNNLESGNELIVQAAMLYVSQVKFKDPVQALHFSKEVIDLCLKYMNQNNDSLSAKNSLSLNYQ